MAKSVTPIEPGVLDELNRLRAARGPIAEWLAGLEAERESVSPSVYRRVREDYAKRIADLDVQARPLRIAATRAIAALDEQLVQLESEKGAVEFDLQEVELRRFLEEYSATEFEERARVPRERIAELGLEVEKIRATRELWLVARGAEIAQEIAGTAAPATPDLPAATPAGVSTAVVAIAPAQPPPTPAIPPPAPLAAVPAGADRRPLSPASITMPRPIAPPRPASPAIAVPPSAEAAGRTVHLPDPPAAAAPSPAPLPGLDRTVVFTPEPPSAVPAASATGDAGDAGDAGATQRLQAMLVPVEPGDAAAKGHALAADNTIGRVRENNIQIQHGSVSRQHAILRFTADGWILEDLEAENGTWVNGERIEKRRLLDGDRVNIGTVRFLFRLG